MQRWNIVALAEGIHISLTRRRDTCIPCFFFSCQRKYRPYNLSEQLVIQLGLQESNNLKGGLLWCLHGGIHISLDQRRDMCIPSLFFDFSSYPLLNEILSVILI